MISGGNGTSRPALTRCRARAGASAALTKLSHGSSKCAEPAELWLRSRIESHSAEASHAPTRTLDASSFPVAHTMLPGLLCPRFAEHLPGACVQAAGECSLRTARRRGPLCDPSTRSALPGFLPGKNMNHDSLKEPARRREANLACLLGRDGRCGGVLRSPALAAHRRPRPRNPATAA
jgi:hypothetical protein